MSKYIIFLVTIVSYLILSSCTDKILDEIDTNPNQVNQAPLKSILPQVELSYANEIVGGSSAIFASYMSEQSTYVLGANSYDRIDDFNEVAWLNGYMLLSDLNALKENAIELEAWGYAGISQMLKALTLSALIDLYGDVPFEESVNSEIRAPKFDDCEEIFYSLFDILDEAISYLEKTSSISPTNDDFYFSGNMQMWIKAAHGIKARLYNKLSNVNPVESAQNALNEIQQSFTETSEKLEFNQYQDIISNANPFSRAQSTQPQTAIGNGLYNCMLSFCDEGSLDEDPRANIWFSKINGEFIAAPNGTAQSDFGEPKMDGAVYSKPQILKYLNAPQPLITYTELLFIKAEAYLRQSKVTESYSTYKNAVKLALQDASDFNQSAALSTNEIDAYLALEKVMPGEQNFSSNTLLKQKYIYYFQYQPIEAFNESRRNNIEESTNPYGRANRMTYPVTEITRNPNVPGEIDIYSIFESNTKLFWTY